VSVPGFHAVAKRPSLFEKNPRRRETRFLKEAGRLGKERSIVGERKDLGPLKYTWSCKKGKSSFEQGSRGGFGVEMRGGKGDKTKRRRRGETKIRKEV